MPSERETCGCPLMDDEHERGSEGCLFEDISNPRPLRKRVPTERHLSDMQVAMEEYREITDRLQQCVQRHRLGLGGERIDVLVCDEVERLRAAHQERDADARRLDWLEGMSATAEHHSGQWFLSWPIYAGGPDPAGSAHEQGPTLRAAIDAAMAPDTQTEGESDGRSH